MATLMESNLSFEASNSNRSPSEQDPFISQATNSNHHRFANFDSNIFSQSPTTSPEQAKRALEAHLAETERRIQDTSRLGTALLQQRKDLEGRLEEIGKQQDEENITPELRQKLLEIEKDYYEVGRESARAFLSKPRVLNNDIVDSSIASGIMDKRLISPSKERFESHGMGSPSKINVSNRRQRNQPINRIHDIEFATEISTSLLSQVRHLQALLAEKDDHMKNIALENSRLEVEIEGFTDRLRSLDESGERYKDENWNLETQLQEYKAKEKEAADRERRLTQNYNIIQSEKSAAQKDLDEIKSAYAKLLEEHNLALKYSDAELGSAKRNLIEIETDRNSLQQKVDELLGQNRELVKAIAYQRGRLEDKNENYGVAIEDLDMKSDDLTPEHSPPPSPVKGTPRHSLLESETLKSSLHHAHRMIQNLKSNIYREKTEKLELKRLLQDTRDELEQRRGEIGQSNGKKARKLDLKDSKRQAKIGQLGGLRNSTCEVCIDESNWEDENQDERHKNINPSQEISSDALHERLLIASTDLVVSTATTPAGTSDHFETANEHEVSDAFETADESAIQKNDLHDSPDNYSEDFTETECETRDLKQRKSKRTVSGNRYSFQSTASTSDDDYDNGQQNYRVINNTQPSRLRLKVNRIVSRRSRVSSEEPHFNSSPASFANTSRDGTPQAKGQSLFAELGEIVGCDEDELIGETPNSFKSTPRSMRSNSSVRALKSRPMLPSAMFRPAMVEFGMMTEPWEPEFPIDPKTVPNIYKSKVNNINLSLNFPESFPDYVSVATQIDSLVMMTDASSQWSEDNLLDKKEMNSQPIHFPNYIDMSSQCDLDKDIMHDNFTPNPKISTSIANKSSTNYIDASSISDKVYLSVSKISSEEFTPIDSFNSNIHRPVNTQQEYSEFFPECLDFSTIQHLEIEPIEPLGFPMDFNPFSNEELENDEKIQNIEPQSLKKWTSKLVKTDRASEICNFESRVHVSTDDFDTIASSNSQLFGQDFVKSNKSYITSKKINTIDESSQTVLTADEIENMLKSIPVPVLIESQRNSSSSSRASQSLSQKISQSEILRCNDQTKVSMVMKTSESTLIDVPRAQSKATYRQNNVGAHGNQISANEKIKITPATAQNIKLSHSTSTNMGPPPLPSNYRNMPKSQSRPLTPNFHVPSSPSINDSPTPRPNQSYGSVVIQTPTRINMRSRVSSISSFASEIDTRFQMHNRVGVSTGMQSGIGSGTDPRMISAITQTMIGEYLWKYTRKTGRGVMSEKRHRRYFWVHPYTRTLYWSNRDPSLAGRAELKAKSVPIEAVRVVTDDNPMPPGLHRKSLIIITPNRAVKFTATTGQRHETWFNSLSYLLLRTEEESLEDTSGVVNGSITCEDVAEFNPSCNNHHTNRNESHAKNSHINGSRSSRLSVGNFSRLSNYWRPSREGLIGSMSSRQSKYSIDNIKSVYEASEVHDSAEDLREFLRRQDRESDKLENVRACCDGRHDVGHLHNSSRSRYTKTISTIQGSSRVEGSVRYDSRNR